jgi:hypothetical protein
MQSHPQATFHPSYRSPNDLPAIQSVLQSKQPFCSDIQMEWSSFYDAGSPASMKYINQHPANAYVPVSMLLVACINAPIFKKPSCVIEAATDVISATVRI